VLLGAVLFRLLFLLETHGDPLFRLLVLDARAYHELALRFASGDFFYGRDPLWFAPLYPSLLGGLFRLIGPDPFGARLVQLALGVGTALLGLRLGRTWSRPVGVVAGAALALSPILVFYENQLLYTSLATFLTASFLGMFVPLARAGSGRRALGSGLLLGALGLVRSNALLFLPVAALILVRRRGVRVAALFTTATLLALVPVLLRNGVASGSWTPLTVNGGMIFATGFAEDSRGGRALLRKPDDFGPRGAYHREAERIANRSMTLAEASRFHRDRTVERILRRPLETVRLTGRKLALLLNAREIDDNLGFPLARGRAASLSWWPAPWSFLVLGSALGVVATFRRRGEGDVESRVIFAFAATYAVSLLLFFVTARYRAPLTVPGAVLAGIGLEWIWTTVRNARWRELGWIAGIVVVAGLVLFRDPGVRADPALARIAVAAAFERDGQSEVALRMTEEALALDPSIAGGHHNRALSLLSLGRTEEAILASREAVRLDPDLYEAWLGLGTALARSNRVGEALPAFRAAVDLAPRHPDALTNLAQALATTGRMREAVEIGRRAVACGADRLVPLLTRWEREADGTRGGD
jgi:tetratricopeptide (TPR) repeat protein